MRNMQNITHIKSRLFWLLFIGGLGVFQVLEGAPQHKMGLVLSGIGLALLGVTGFLQPLDLGKPEGALLETPSKTKIGPDRLHAVLSVIAVVCLLTGMALRYGFDL